jgi:putative ABC transport system permease protein
LPTRRNDAPQAVVAFYDLLLARLRAIPGVKEVALSSSVPLRNPGLTMGFSIRGRGSDGTGHEVLHHRISGDYFKALGIPLISGRTFGDGDALGSEPVIMINEALASKYFQGRDPIGQYIANDLVPDSTSRWARIVGVVGNERQFALGTPPKIEIFDPLRQDVRTGFHVVMSASVDPSSLFRPLEQAIAAIDPALPIVSLVTIDSVVEASLARERFMAMLLAAFAVVGAVLAVVGVYGVVAQAAIRRIPEMGIRMALGADPAHVRWMIVRHGLVLTAMGATVGAVAALLAGGAVRQMLFEVSHRDVVTFGVVIGTILLTGVAASWLPALRVTRQPTASVLNR